MSAEASFLPMLFEFFNDDPMTATYHQELSGAYDPSTGEFTSTSVSTSVKGILLDIDRISNGLSSKYGTEILMGDKEFYMLPTQKVDGGANAIVPNPTTDTVIVAGITYKVHIVKSIDPTGANPLVYNMLLRR